MEPTEIFWTAAPAIFGGGGVYAVFRWRLNRVEKAVEKTAETCIQNRSLCSAGLGSKIESLRVEIRDEFEDSKKDRKDLREAMHALDVKFVRLDQKVLNGHSNHQ